MLTERSLRRLIVDETHSQLLPLILLSCRQVTTSNLRRGLELSQFSLDASKFFWRLRLPQTLRQVRLNLHHVIDTSLAKLAGMPVVARIAEMVGGRDVHVLGELPDEGLSGVSCIRANQA